METYLYIGSNVAFRDFCSQRRGMLVMVEGALVNDGIMISYMVNFDFSFING